MVMCLALTLFQSGGSEGLGFAIPARVVRFVYQGLQKHGHVLRVEIQAALQTISPTLAEGLGLAQSYGVIVSDVAPGGPAEAAGLKVGDIVVSADDRPIDTLPALYAEMYPHPVDQVLKMVVKRGSDQKVLYIPVLEQRNEIDKLVDEIDPDKSLVPWGFWWLTWTRGFVPSLAMWVFLVGAVVTARAAELLVPDTGPRSGDVIHAVNHAPIDSVDSLRTITRDLKAELTVSNTGRARRQAAMAGI
jgi:serine protease Do